jgi:hypothetical protein
MEVQHEQQKPPDVLAEQRVSNELVKLIRKLRWVGMDDEAGRIQDKLALCGVPAVNCVVAATRETD